MVAKAFGTAVLDSPDLLNVTKIDVLTFAGLEEVVEWKRLESKGNLFQSVGVGDRLFLEQIARWLSDEIE